MHETIRNQIDTQTRLISQFAQERDEVQRRLDLATQLIRGIIGMADRGHTPQDMAQRAQAALDMFIMQEGE